MTLSQTRVNLGVETNAVRYQNYSAVIAAHYYVEAGCPVWLARLGARAKTKTQALIFTALMSACSHARGTMGHTEILRSDIFAKQLQELAEKHADLDLEFSTLVLKKDSHGKPMIIKYVLHDEDSGDYATLTFVRGKGARYAYKQEEPGFWHTAWRRAQRRSEVDPGLTKLELFVKDFAQSLNEIDQYEREHPEDRDEPMDYGRR